MKFKIKETGKLEELNYVDPKTGRDAADDIIGNSGVIGKSIIYDEESDTYLISQYEYDWWAQYLYYHDADMQELEQLREEYDNEAIDKIVIRDFYPNDMEDEHYCWQQVFEAIRDELEEQ